MNRRVTFSLMVLGLLGATAEAVERPGKSELRVGLSGDIASTEWATKHDDNTIMVLQHVLEGLVAYRDDMTVGPMLAESIDVSPDLRTYTFRLRPGLKFHNGAPVTAELVKWNWDRFRDPKRDWGSHCREWYDGSAEMYHRPTNIVSIDTPDERTVVFHLQYASSVFLHLMASNHCITGIVHPSSLKADGSWDRPIATGPFELRQWRKGEFVELEKFAGYQARPEPRTGFTGNKTAEVDVLRLVSFGDAQKAKTALLKGEIDTWFKVPVDVAEELRGNRRLRLHFQQTPAWHQIVIQARHDPLLKDARMRRAIAHAIDGERVSREATGGVAKPNPSAVALGLPFHSEVHASGLPYDLDKSRALQREAGYQGQPIRIQASREPYPVFHRVAASVARMLNEAGIKAEVETVEWPVQDRSYAENKYQLTSMTFSTRTDPAFMYSALVGQKADHSWYLWEDVEADSLVVASTVTADTAARQALFDRLHAKMLEWSPTVGIFNYFLIDATSERVTGFETWALGIPRYWGVRKMR